MMKLSTTTTTLAFSIALLFNQATTTTLAFAPLLRQNSAFHPSTKVSAVTVKAPNPRSISPGNASRSASKKKSKLVGIDTTAKMRRPKWGVDKEHEDEYWFNTQVRKGLLIDSAR